MRNSSKGDRANRLKDDYPVYGPGWRINTVAVPTDIRTALGTCMEQGEAQDIGIQALTVGA
jgi:hypothetical protein